MNQNISADELLQLAASAESRSEHPLAAALVRAAAVKGLALLPPAEFLAVPGQGIGATVNGKRLMLGSRSFVQTHLPAPLAAPVLARAGELAECGKTVLYVAMDGTACALLAIADQLKAEAPRAVSRLQALGLTVIMLTGDNEKTARAIAQQAGITAVLARVLPEQKAAKVEELQQQGHRVAMVGDGINDAPALARADVGIAMGTGIDVAIESADLVVMRGNPEAVVTAVALSRAVMTNIRQNLFWAFAYNVLGIPIAAGLPYLFGGPALSPMLAGAAMALSSFSVVTNALRLRFFTPKEAVVAAP